MNDPVTIRITVTGTYTVPRSRFPTDYQLPADAPVDEVIAIDKQEIDNDDEFMAVTLMETETVKVTIEEATSE